MLYSDFKEALAAGDVGEGLASLYLSTIGYEVEDVSANQEYFEPDIDLIAKTANETMYVEVKADSRMNGTGNAVVETVSNFATGREGWYYKTKASHIFFVDVVANIIHCVRFEELKDLYETKRYTFRHIRTHQMENGTYYKEAEIALIPIAKLMELPHYVQLNAENVAAVA